MASNPYNELPETPCIFKPAGISRHQAAAKLLRLNELLKVVENNEDLEVYNLAFQKIGNVPPYLELMLKPCVNAAPDGHLYVKVKAIQGKQTVGIWCVLLDAPTLPEFLTSGRVEMSVWSCKVRGVTFEGRQAWWNKLEEEAALEGSYPHVLLRREDANPVDVNAIKILSYVPVEGWQQIGYVDREDAKEIRMSAQAGMSFYVRLISIGRTEQSIMGGMYEIVGMSSSPAGFEALT